jgi:hypothetical protein
VDSGCLETAKRRTTLSTKSPAGSTLALDLRYIR